MLNIYTDTGYLTKENRRFVFPLLLDLYFIKSKTLAKYFNIVDNAHEADVIILPLEYVHFAANYDLNSFIERAEQANCPIWVYTGGDFGYSINAKNIFNFRLGGLKKNLNENTFILPSFIEDPYNKFINGSFLPLKKENMATIGFVGHAHSGVFKYAKEVLSFIFIELKRRFKKHVYMDDQPFYPSSIKRARYLRSLQSSNLIKTNFIFRKSYRAGAKDEKMRFKTTTEFFENIYNEPYTFCMRGVGNFSVRLYETLAVGRIPVVINTDCQFPLEHLIDWKKHCLIIEDSAPKVMDEKIANFHELFSNEDFKMMQIKNRELWTTVLSREGFFKEVHDVFESKKMKI